MKKLLILFLVLSLMFIFMAIPAMAKEEHSGEYSQEMLEVAEKVLLDLGLWQEFSSDEIYLTRAEMAVIVCRIANVYDIAVELNNSEAKSIYSPFKDVPSDYWASGFILIAQTICWDYYSDVTAMQGDGNGYFRPDDKVLLQEFVKTLLVSIGWGDTYIVGNVVEKYSDLYPSGYLKMADLLGIYPISDEKVAKPITKNDAIILLYNALKAPGFKSANVFSTMPIYDIEGWLENRKDIISIRGYAKKTDENTLTIEGHELLCDSKTIKVEEGLVLCFYKKSDSSLVGCYPISSIVFDNPKEISETIPRGRIPRI